MRLSGTRGEPAPDRLKVAINYLGGFRNSMSFVLTGLDIEAKAAMAETALFERLGGRERFQSAETRLVGHPAADPASAEEAVAELRVTVKDPDPSKVGRAFSTAAIELPWPTTPAATPPPHPPTPPPTASTGRPWSAPTWSSRWSSSPTAAAWSSSAPRARRPPGSGRAPPARSRAGSPGGGT